MNAGYEVGCFKTDTTTDAEFDNAFDVCGGGRIPKEELFNFGEDKYTEIAQWYENKHKETYPESTVEFKARPEQ